MLLARPHRAIYSRSATQIINCTNKARQIVPQSKHAECKNKRRQRRYTTSTKTQVTARCRHHPGSPGRGHIFLSDTRLGHRHEVTSVYCPRPTSQISPTKVYMCTSPCTVCVPIRAPLQTDYLFIPPQREKRSAGLPAHRITCVCVFVHARTHTSAPVCVYPARPVMSVLSGDRLINV